jgi:hypothetical protein
VPDVCVDPSTYNAAQSATRSTGSRYYDAGFVSTEESKAGVLNVWVCNIFASHKIRLEIRMSVILNVIRTQAAETMAMITCLSNLMHVGAHLS